MSKISNLPQIATADIDGTETLPVVKSGITKRLLASVLVQKLAQPFIDLTKAWAQSDTPPDPTDASSKSAKTLAGEADASRLGAVAAAASIDGRVLSKPVRHPSLVPLAVDAAGKVPLWLEDGLLGGKGFSAALIASVISAVRTTFSLASSADYGSKRSPSLVPLAVSNGGKIPVWLEDGLLGAKGLAPSLINNIISTIQTNIFAMIATSYAPRNAPIGTSFPIASDGRKLTRWRAKLGTMLLPTVAKTRLLLIGDSWLDRLTIPQQLAAVLHPRLGNAGGGFVPLYASNGGPMNGATVTRSAGWTGFDAGTASGVTSLPAFGVGIDGTCLYTTNNTDTINFVFSGNGFRIYYAKTTGTFRYRVDGGAWTAVTGDGSNALGIISISGLTSGAHTVDVDTTGNTGTAVLYAGRIMNSGVSGIEIMKCGNGSLDSAQLKSYASTYITPMATDFLPDAVLVVLGTNDYRRSYNSPANYLTAMAALVTSVRAAVPDAGFIFVAPADSNWATPATPLSAYRDALIPWCLANGHEFYNMNEDWGLWAAENANTQFDDDLHINDAGANRLARSLTRLFLGDER